MLFHALGLDATDTRNLHDTRRTYRQAPWLKPLGFQEATNALPALVLRCTYIQVQWVM